MQYLHFFVNEKIADNYIFCQALGFSLACQVRVIVPFIKDPDCMKTPWRNGSASDSRSEGCVFKSRRGHVFDILNYMYYDINVKDIGKLIIHLQNIVVLYM